MSISHGRRWIITTRLCTRWRVGGGSDNHLLEDKYRQEVVNRQHPLGEDRYQQGEGMFPLGQGTLLQEEGIVQQGEDKCQVKVGGDARALLKGPLY